MIRRRSLFGLGAALAAPLVVPCGRIMPVKALPPPATAVYPSARVRLVFAGHELRFAVADPDVVVIPEIEWNHA